MVYMVGWPYFDYRKPGHLAGNEILKWYSKFTQRCLINFNTFKVCLLCMDIQLLYYKILSITKDTNSDSQRLHNMLWQVSKIISVLHVWLQHFAKTPFTMASVLVRALLHFLAVSESGNAFFSNASSDFPGLTINSVELLSPRTAFLCFLVTMCNGCSYASKGCV